MRAGDSVSSPSVRPYPVSRTVVPIVGFERFSRIGSMSVIGLLSLASATSAVGDCRTAITVTSCPSVPVRSARPTVATVVRATSFETCLPWAFLKQWPAVSTHCGAISPPEHELSRSPPSAVGMSVIVSLTENG